MGWESELDQKIKEYLPDLKMECNIPMARHTSFHIGGPAKRMAFPSNSEQMVLLTSFAKQCGANPLVIGNGTNLLVDDAGLDRLVIDTSSNMNRMELTDRCTIVADAGVSLRKLAIFAWEHGLTGLEFAHGIPGTLGGAVYMNAGAYGGEMKQVVAQVTALYPEGIRKLTPEQADFGYRHSVFSDGTGVVLSAELQLAEGNSDDIRAKMDDLMMRRKTSQPLEYPSAGSTFKRPEGYFAGTLIDQCGLKGTTVGGACVSPKHAGFLINTGGATCSDVLRLIALIQNTVERKTGVRLEPELKYIR